MIICCSSKGCACEKGRRKIAAIRRGSSCGVSQWFSGRTKGGALATKLLFADENGRVYEHPHLLALVRGGLPMEAPSPLPEHASLSVLPGRRPLGFDRASGRTEELSEVRLGRRTVRPSAVAAVLPPGWTRTELPAFRKLSIAPLLPQWAYTAAAWDDERGCHVAWALHTDRRTHWDPSTHSTRELPRLVEERLARDKNPLLRQLAKCA